jgi:uncharacterized membrane protein
MRKFLENTHADLGGAATMMGVVIATLIAIVIGVLIWYKINTSMYTAAGSPHTAAAGSAVWNATNSSANTIWSLFPIVCIVLIAGVVLAIVMGFGRGQA